MNSVLPKILKKVYISNQKALFIRLLSILGKRESPEILAVFKSHKIIKAT
jgi:hypothetical protein